MKKVLISCLGLVVIIALLAWAGGEKKSQEMQQMSPEQMKAEFAKCGVCKNMIPYMDQAWWMGMKHEVYNLKNGALFIHSYPTATEKELADIHTMCRSMETASAEIEKLPAKEQAGKVCPQCQEWFNLVKAGAKTEWVLTKTGSLGIISADKPKTVENIHTMADKWRQMFAGTPEKM